MILATLSALILVDLLWAASIVDGFNNGLKRDKISISKKTNFIVILQILILNS
jgi:hypothetical protein